RVAVVVRALEQRGHRRRARVRVAGHLQPAGGRDVVGPEVVREAPGADERGAPRRQRAVDGHAARAAERHRAGLQQLEILEGAHGPSVGSGRARRWERPPWLDCRMDALPFFIMLAVALIDIVFAAWFIRRGVTEGAGSARGRSTLMVGGTMIIGAIMIIALAFFLFGPFGED